MLPSSLLMTLLMLWTVLWAVVVAEIDVSANPAIIDVGLSSALDVNCVVSINETAVAGIMSILLSREPSSGGNTTELATINEFSPSKVNLMSSEGISADGTLDRDGQSYIHLHWDYPVAEQAGTYHCMAQGMDQFGHMLSLNNVSVVSGNQPDLVEVMDKMKQMEQHFSDVDKELADVRQNLAEANSVILGLETIMFEMPPFEYNGSQYLLSHLPFTSCNDSVNICKAIGGYLAEVNNADELKAMLTFVNDSITDTGVFVYIGGEFDASKGEWVLPFSNLPFPFPYQDFDSQNKKDHQDNCLFLLKYGTWQTQVYPNTCDTDYYERFADEVHFMCEII